MKIPSKIIACGLGAFLFGTAAFANAFEEFRNKVGQKVPAGWVCGDIRNLEEKTFFEIRSQENRFSIVINLCDTISLEEWVSRSERKKKAFKMLTSAEKIDETEANEVMTAVMYKLPDGSYKNIAVSVDLLWPDLWYPEIESENQNSKKVHKVILDMLQIYKEEDFTEQPVKQLELRPDEDSNQNQSEPGAVVNASAAHGKPENHLHD